MSIYVLAQNWSWSHLHSLLWRKRYVVWNWSSSLILFFIHTGVRVVLRQTCTSTEIWNVILKPGAPAKTSFVIFHQQTAPQNPLLHLEHWNAVYLQVNLCQLTDRKWSSPYFWRISSCLSCISALLPGTKHAHAHTHLQYKKKNPLSVLLQTMPATRCG